MIFCMMSSRLRCDVSPSPQTPYLVGTAPSAVGGRSVCLTPRCSSRNWRGSTPPINSSPRTKGGGYPRRRTWQRDKWQSGFRTDAWRRRRWWTNSRAPVSSGELRGGVRVRVRGEGWGVRGGTWMRLHPRKLCYNLLRCMDGALCRQSGSVGLFRTYTFPSSRPNWNQPMRPVDRRSEMALQHVWPGRFCERMNESPAKRSPNDETLPRVILRLYFYLTQPRV